MFFLFYCSTPTAEAGSLHNLSFTGPTLTDVLSYSLMEYQSDRLSPGNFAVVLFIYGFIFPG